MGMGGCSGLTGIVYRHLLTIVTLGTNSLIFPAREPAAPAHPPVAGPSARSHPGPRRLPPGPST
jgi:hypothetical protein